MRIEDLKEDIKKKAKKVVKIETIVPASSLTIIKMDLKSFLDELKEDETIMETQEHFYLHLNDLLICCPKESIRFRNG